MRGAADPRHGDAVPCAGALDVGDCARKRAGADDVGYKQSNYAREPQSVASYYSPVDFSTPYLPGSPVYGHPYVNGPVMGGIYAYGDARDDFGGPLFSPYYGITCDRRRVACWSRNGHEPRWTARFFGRQHSDWNYADWHPGNQGNGWGGQGHGPYVYQVPRNPDGSGAPAFLPNCGGQGQPAC